MKVSINAIAGAIKRAQDAEVVKRRPPPPRHHKRLTPSAYPDYGKSMVNQLRGDPQIAGILRGLLYGTGGAAIGGGAAALADQPAPVTGLASILAGLATGAAGYQSGKHERESENSKLLFLRRLGIDNPGELDAMTEYRGLQNKLTKPREELT